MKNNIILNFNDIDTYVNYISSEVYHIVRNENILSVPIFTCVLDGGFMFYSDLIKRLNFNLYTDFIKTSTYKYPNLKSEPELIVFPNQPIQNRLIFLVDDIFDSGETMNYLIKQYYDKGAYKVIPVTLLKRYNSPSLANHICGYCLNDDSWVGGYGMDDENGLNRNCNNIFKCNINGVN